MKLTEQETEAVNIRLKRYRKLYGEVFNELYDHILSLIEARREQGDDRHIIILLHEVIDRDFEGDKGLHRIALRGFMRYSDGLWDELWVVLKQNRIPFLILTILILSAGYFVPYSIQLNMVLIAACLISACVPLGYLIYRKGIKGAFDKTSIKSSTVGSFSMSPVVFFYVLFGYFYVIGPLIDGHTHECPMWVSGILLLCLVTYAVSYIKFYEQKFTTVV
ncbi:hypothetical protein ACFGVR_11765 [Mucilaginibacter sp. AW1-3]